MLTLFGVIAQVTPLTSSTFDDFIATNEFVFVKFYAPWCGHCKALAPAYLEASEGSRTPFAEVDCTTNQDICGRFGVNGYPTLKLFKKGQPTDYNGGRDAASLRSFVRHESGDVLTEITKSDLKKDVKQRKLLVYFVLYCPRSQIDAIKKTLLKFDAFVYYIESNETKLVASRQDYQYTLKNLNDERQIASFITKYQYPFVPQVTQDNFYRYAETPGKRLAILVPGQEEIEKLVELSEVSSPDYLRELRSYQFVKAKPDFINQVVNGSFHGAGPALVFFNAKNQVKIRYQINNFDETGNVTAQLMDFLKSYDTNTMNVLDYTKQDKQEL